MNFIEQYHRAFVTHYTPDDVAQQLGMPITPHPTTQSLLQETDTHHMFINPPYTMGY